MEMNYVAPELEVLEVMVEKGFAATGPGGSLDTGAPEGPGGDLPF